MQTNILDYINRRDVQDAIANDPEFARKLMAWVMTMAQLKSLILQPYDLEARALAQMRDLLLPANAETLRGAHADADRILQAQIANMQAALQKRQQDIQLLGMAMQQRALAQQMALAQPSPPAQQMAPPSQRRVK